MAKIRIKDIINNVKKYSLSGDELSKLLGCPVVGYLQLPSYESLDQVFQDNKCNSVILFFPVASESVGHWTLLTKEKDHIEYFDPYGYPPDYVPVHYPKMYHRFYDSARPLRASEVKSFNTKLKKIMPIPNWRLPFTRLIRAYAIDGNGEFQWSMYELQKRSDPSLATCGHWLIVRRLFKNITSLHGFQGMFAKKNYSLTRDELVSALTTFTTLFGPSGLKDDLSEN